MMNEFLGCLLGDWSNKLQAMGNPTGFAWILISWKQVEKDKYHSKQWYHYMGENSPYRERYHTFSETESGIIMYNYDLTWTRNEKCDIRITPDNRGKWLGRNIGMECIVRDAVLHSEFQLTQDLLMTRDAGYLNNKMMWGSEEHYQFGRLTQR